MTAHTAENAASPEKSAAFCRACLAPVSEAIGEKDGYALLRCGDCGTVVVDPWPTDAELDAYYRDYRKTGEYMRKRDSKIRRGRGRIKRMLKAKPPGKRFLDVGCNVGFMIVGAKNAGLEATGIDIDESAIAIAKKEFGDAGSFECIPVQDMAARGDEYDMIYCNEVVEHVPDPDDFIKAVSKLLAPGGILYITAPDGGHRAVPKDFASWGMVCPPEHLSYFTRKGMETLLGRHGLDIRKYAVSFKPGIKAIAVKRG